MITSEIESYTRDFCQKNNISMSISYDMPVGYETAYGTYDVTVNTLFLNIELIKNAPKYEAYFYLLHELRHAMQYLSPSLFNEQIQESRFYVVLYNGVCYKLTNNKWRECALKGSEEYFTRLYLNLPYEIDANAYAYKKAKELFGDTIQLRELYAFWQPTVGINYNEYKELFCRIDDELS